MNIFTVSEAQHHRLQRFRRNTWKAIALCAALRFADTAFGFGLVEPAHTPAAREVPVCSVEQQASEEAALAKLKRQIT